MPSKPSPLISYAQNGEDVVLARALKPWERKGFWVDCGAGHPKYDSVTKLFSLFGWTGINVEPLDDEFLLLQQDRPQDENIKCLLGSEDGSKSFFAGPFNNRGSSTTDPALVDRYEREFGQHFNEIVVPVRRLDQIFESKLRPRVDFLKIDVEGAEADVIKGANLGKLNPKILVVEATRPNSDEPSFEAWEPSVLSSGFTLALFDGLNRFYVNNDDLELLPLLQSPANVLDNFISLRLHELESRESNLAESTNASARYSESLTNVIHEKDLVITVTTERVEELKNIVGEKEFEIANLKQRVLDLQSDFLILKRVNEALEKRVVNLLKSESQLATIRSYRIFRILSLTKRILRKLSGRS